MWVKEADSLYDQGKFEEAAALYGKFSKLDEAAKQRWQTARAIASSGGKAEVLLPIAAQALDQSKPQMAQRLCQVILKGNSMGAVRDEARVRLGWSLYLQGGKTNEKQAEELWQQVSREGSASEKWQIEAEWHLVQLASGPQGDWKKGVSLCDMIIHKRAPGTFAHEQALFVKAWLLLIDKQWKESLAAYEELQSIYPEKSAHLPYKNYLKQAQEGLAASEGKSAPAPGELPSNGVIP